MLKTNAMHFQIAEYIPDCTSFSRCLTLSTNIHPAV